MHTSSSSDNNSKIGAVFTPFKWAEFAIAEFGLFKKWLDGNSVFDPTFGCGNLLLALLEHGVKLGYEAKKLPFKNLHGVELNAEFAASIFKIAKHQFDIDLPRENFLNEDILFLEKEPVFDIVFANPPWQNFTDLPNEYKQKIKQQFFRYDLANNPKDLLLGGSRIDIAALIIQKTIQKNLKKNGEAIFFSPLSLLLNDGANQSFRTYRIHETQYHLNKVFDFNDLKVFEGIATRHALIGIKRDERQKFPIDYQRWENNKWNNLQAKPLFKSTDPLSIFKKNETSHQQTKILIKKHSQPRQGVNSCGANHLFFFDNCYEIDEKECKVTNKKIEATLPKKYLYPLITISNFCEDSLKPKKWVLLPYNQSGKPLKFFEIKNEPSLHSYLTSHQSFLQNRKGILINSWIKKGIWWAMLGIGEYSFYPFKVAWEAYGKSSFVPKIFPQNWQANQSLQAFMPSLDRCEAEGIIERINKAEVEKYLLSLKMEGTMNWAQPGKIKKLITFQSELPSLFNQI